MNPDFLTDLNIIGRAKQKQFKQRLAALILRHHVYLPQSVRMMEMELCERLLPGTVDVKIQSQIRIWQQAMAKTCHHDANNAGLQQWNQQYIANLPAKLLQNPQLAALWALAQKHSFNRGEIIHYPDSINRQHIDFILTTETQNASHECRIFQMGNELRITGKDSTTELSGSYYADLTLTGDLSLNTESKHEPKVESCWQWPHSKTSFSVGNSKLLVKLGQNIR